MKHFFILLIVLAMLMNFIGCSNSKQESTKNILMEKVITLETNKAKLFDLEITYGEFKKSIDGIFTTGFKKEYLKRLDARQILNINGDVILIKDLEGISEEKFKEYQKKV